MDGYLQTKLPTAMRAILFLVLVVCLGTSSQAQDQSAVPKVKSIALPIAQTLVPSEFQIQKSQTAAIFFKVKHGRVKRALLFKPKAGSTQIV